MSYYILIATEITEPEIPDVVNEIADVSNWEKLGILLGLEINDLDTIRINYDQTEYHQRLAEKWRDRGSDYTWAKLLRVLDKVYPRRHSSVSVSSPQPESLGKWHIIEQLMGVYKE